MIDLDTSGYKDYPMVAYGRDEYKLYVRVCPECGRYVKADKQAQVYREDDPPNATCKVHGRVSMPAYGWFSDESEGV